MYMFMSHSIHGDDPNGHRTIGAVNRVDIQARDARITRAGEVRKSQHGGNRAPRLRSISENLGGEVNMRTQSKSPIWLTQQELATVMAAASSNLRDQLALEFCVTFALRRSELVGLQLKNLADGMIRCE